MTADGARYEITLACGDTVSSASAPRIGAYRMCIHCDGRRRVTEVIDRAECEPACRCGYGVSQCECEQVGDVFSVEIDLDRVVALARMRHLATCSDVTCEVCMWLIAYGESDGPDRAEMLAGVLHTPAGEVSA